MTLPASDPRADSSQQPRRPVVLIVRDGWGVADESPEAAEKHGNAVALAKLPCLNNLLATYPHALLQASGEAVGLPPGQMGNSEVGHQNLGAGRVTYQDLMRITVAIRDGSFFQNPTLLEAMRQARESGGHLHLMGLVSDGGVHSHVTHLFALLEMAQKNQVPSDRVAVHAILDGRDTAPRSGAGYLKALEAEIKRTGMGYIATVIGRYYSMDRDNRWERTAKAYQAYVNSAGRRAVSASAAIQASYEADVTDEFVQPTLIMANGQATGQITDGDVVIFFNFRPDRARQISRSFTNTVPEGAPLEASQPHRSIHYVCMTEYDSTIPAPAAFSPEDVSDPIGEVVAEAGLRQLRIAETEKYAHVTYFFNGGSEAQFTGEDRVLIPSPKVATYDLAPEMSADTVTERLLELLAQEPMPYALVVLNFANPDMVGHTGDLQATVKAVEIVDACVARIVERVREIGGIALITADHGNAEQMVADDGTPLTAHTTNPVHFILVDDQHRDAHLRDGIFADVAPTVLQILSLREPTEMTGRSLFV